MYTIEKRKAKVFNRRLLTTIKGILPFIIGLIVIILVASFGESCSGRFEGDANATCIKIINLK